MTAWRTALAILPIAINATVVRAAPPASAIADLRPAQLLELGDRALAEGALAEAESLYRAVTTNREVAVRSEARFRLAVMLDRQKRHAEAATLLRQILDEQPAAGRVRLELARVLAAMGRQSAALRELRQASAGSLPPDVALIVKQVTQAYRAQKPFGVAVEVALAPDSNINRATRAETLDTVLAPLMLSDDARARSGIGLELSGQVYVRVPVAPRVQALVRSTGHADLYRQAAFSSVYASGRAGVEWLAGRWLVRPTVGRGWQWFGGDYYAVTDTAQVEIRRPVGPRAQIELDATAGFSSYRRNALQTGGVYNLGLTYERALTPRSGLSIALSADRQEARDRAYATRAYGATLTYWHEIDRTTLSVAATGRTLKGDAAFSLFGTNRRETYFRLNAAASLRKLSFRGFAPVVRTGFERNASSIGLYDYSRKSVEIGLTRAF